MSRHVWFPLAIRALGLALAGFCVGGVIESAGSLIYALRNPGRGAWDPIYVTLSSIGHVVPFVFGLYLLLGGRALIRWCMRDIDTMCPRCGYSCAGVTAGKCPECAFELDHSRDRSAPQAATSGSTPASEKD